MDEPLPELRIGDRERREVDDRLREALADGVLTLTEYDERTGQCWAARTRGDLDVITQDLPVRAPLGPVVASAGTAPPRRGTPRRVGIALIAAAVVGGGLYVLGGIGADDGAAVFGSRVVQVTAGQERVEVGSLFGSVEVVVPDDVQVRPMVSVVFGSVDCDAACAEITGARDVVLEADVVFGSVDIVSQSEHDRDD